MMPAASPSQVWMAPPRRDSPAGWPRWGQGTAHRLVLALGAEVLSTWTCHSIFTLCFCGLVCRGEGDEHTTKQGDGSGRGRGRPCSPGLSLGLLVPLGIFSQQAPPSPQLPSALQAPNNSCPQFVGQGSVDWPRCTEKETESQRGASALPESYPASEWQRFESRYTSLSAPGRLAEGQGGATPPSCPLLPSPHQTRAGDWV